MFRDPRLIDIVGIALLILDVFGHNGLTVEYDIRPDLGQSFTWRRQFLAFESFHSKYF